MSDERVNEQAVRDVIDGVLAGRWAMANAKHWFERHVPEGPPDGHEDCATTLARRALCAVRARYGGAPREWVEERLVELLAGSSESQSAPTGSD